MCLFVPVVAVKRRRVIQRPNYSESDENFSQVVVTSRDTESWYCFQGVCLSVCLSVCVCVIVRKTKRVLIRLDS